MRQMKGLLGEQDHLLTLWVPSHQHHDDGLYYCSYVTAYECSQRGLDIYHTGLKRPELTHGGGGFKRQPWLQSY